MKIQVIPSTRLIVLKTMSWLVREDLYEHSRFRMCNGSLYILKNRVQASGLKNYLQKSSFPTHGVPTRIASANKTDVALAPVPVQNIL